MRAEVEGRVVDAHLPDPGRRRGLLLPGAELRLRPAASSSRRTRFTVSLVRATQPPRPWVSVETQRANDLMTDAPSRVEPEQLLDLKIKTLE